MDSFFTFSFDKSLKKPRVTSDSSELFSALLDVFTVPNPQYFYLERNGCSFADEYLSAITPLGTFAIGLFPRVYKAALELVKGDKEKIVVSDEDKKLIFERCTPLRGKFTDDYYVESIPGERKLRWYQREAASAMLKYGRGMCIAPTAAGKSYIAATVISELRKNGFPSMGGKNRILLLVPTRQLVDQMHGDFTEYGMDGFCKFTSDSGSKRSGTYQDNSCSNGFEEVIITNHSWLRKHGKDENFPIGEIGCIIADEVHSVGGKEILKIVNGIEAPLKLGFTATLPSAPFDRWRIQGAIGPTLYTIDIKTLQDEGFLTKLEIYSIRGNVKEVDENRKLPFSLRRTVKLNDVLEDGSVVDVGTAYQMEQSYMEENAARLYPPMFDAVSEFIDFGKQNVIVLFDRISIGKIISEELKKKFDGISNVMYIDGSIDVGERERIRSSLEASSGNILVAQSVTASVGLNIKNLHGIVFAFSGKSYVKVIQSIGRVLRKKSGKTVAKLFELCYNMRYSQSHHAEKMAILSENYGNDSIRAKRMVEL